MQQETGQRTEAAGTILRLLYHNVVMKRELSQKANLSIYRSIYIPTLTSGHDGWVMTKRMRSLIQSVITLVTD